LTKLLVLVGLRIDFIGKRAGHEHEGFETLVGSAEEPADFRVITVTDIS